MKIQDETSSVDWKFGMSDSQCVDKKTMRKLSEFIRI